VRDCVHADSQHGCNYRCPSSVFHTILFSFCLSAYFTTSTTFLSISVYVPPPLTWHFFIDTFIRARIRYVSVSQQLSSVSLCMYIYRPKCRRNVSTPSSGWNQPTKELRRLRLARQKHRYNRRLHGPISQNMLTFMRTSNPTQCFYGFPQSLQDTQGVIPQNFVSFIQFRK
jgi:hypothetical protein